MQQYSWWGFGENEPPEHLKTKKQLNAMGKKPGEPVAVIRTPEYDCYLYDPETCPNKRPLTEKQRTYQERRRKKKAQMELEARRAEAELDLEATTTRWLPVYVDCLVQEFEREDNPFRERWVKNRCDRIIQVCKTAKEALRFLYPPPEPEPGSLVLGGRIPRALLDSDGQCRAAVLGGLLGKLK